MSDANEKFCEWNLLLIPWFWIQRQPVKSKIIDDDDKDDDDDDDDHDDDDEKWE